MTKISNQYSLTNVLTADPVNGRVGVNNGSPTVALDVTGAGLFSSSLTTGGAIFTTNSPIFDTAGTITKHAVVGLVVRGTTASVFDFSLYSAGGTALMTNPTGTNNINFNSGQVWFNGGNVGIGTSSPDYRLRIETSSADVFLTKNTSSTSFNRSYFYNNNNTGVQMLSFGSSYAFGTEYAVGAGGFVMQSNTTSAFAIGTSTATPLILGTNGTERMRITSAGNIGIGTSSPGSLLTVKGSGNYDGQIAVDNGTTTGGGILYIKQNNVVSGFYSTRGSALGNTSRDLSIYANDGLGIYTYTNGGTAGPYVASGGTSWTSSSDERLKTIKNIIPNAIESISTLRAVIHTWKYDAEEKEHLGLIAQDLQKVYPQVVVENDDDIKTLGVNYTELVPVLVKAIQELSAQASEQQTQINELKALLNA